MEAFIYSTFLCLDSELKIALMLIKMICIYYDGVFLINLLYCLDTFVYSLFGLGLSHPHYSIKLRVCYLMCISILSHLSC